MFFASLRSFLAVNRLVYLPVASPPECSLDFQYSRPTPILARFSLCRVLLISPPLSLSSARVRIVRRLIHPHLSVLPKSYIYSNVNYSRGSTQSARRWWGLGLNGLCHLLIANRNSSI